MKKYIFFIIAILILVIFVSCCTNNENQTSNQSQTFNQSNQSNIPTKTYSSANGVSFNYPKGWERAGQSEEYTIISGADINMVLSFGDTKSVEKYDGYNDYFRTVVVIEKAQLPFWSSLKNAYYNAYVELAQQDFAFKSISNTITTVDGKKAYVKTYTVVESGVQRQVKAVWFEKKGFVYVILLVTSPEDFDSQQKNFNIILNSFNVQ